MFSKLKDGFGILIASIIVIIGLASVSAKAQEVEEDDDDIVSQELPLEAMSFRYSSLDASIWESCTVEKANETHDFFATCGVYKFKAHVLFRVWPAANGAPPDEKTYDLLVMVDRKESNGSTTSVTAATELNVAGGGKVNKITSDVSFDGGNTFLQTRVDLKNLKKK